MGSCWHRRRYETCCGDHVAFNQQHGFTAVRLSEANEDFSRQHTIGDTIDGVNFPYLALNARVNAAGLATLALAPPAPNGRAADGSDAGNDARLRLAGIARRCRLSHLLAADPVE